MYKPAILPNPVPSGSGPARDTHADTSQHGTGRPVVLSSGPAVLGAQPSAGPRPTPVTPIPVTPAPVIQTGGAPRVSVTRPAGRAPGGPSVLSETARTVPREKSSPRVSTLVVTSKAPVVTAGRPVAVLPGSVSTWKVDLTLGDDVLFQGQETLGVAEKAEVRELLAGLSFRDIKSMLAFGHELDTTMVEMSSGLLRRAQENGGSLDRLMEGVHEAVMSVRPEEIVGGGTWSVLRMALTGRTPQGEIERALDTVDRLLPEMAAEVGKLQSSLGEIESLWAQARKVLDACIIHGAAGKVALAHYPALRKSLENEQDGALKIREADLARSTLQKRVDAFLRMRSDLQMTVAQASLQKAVIVEKINTARSSLLEMVSGWKRLCSTVITCLAQEKGDDLEELASKMGKARDDITHVVNGVTKK